MQFSLNHMVAPQLSYAAFFDLAVSLGVNAVEIRNDIASSLMGPKNAKMIANLAKEKGLTIVTVNALQRFNQWTKAKADEAKKLAEYTALTGAKALILVPTNDVKFQPDRAARLGGLRESLQGLAPILKQNGLTGLVEPLGFAECSLRLKAEAIAAIDDVGATKQFKVTHDTFHHYVAGEKKMFADRTGLIHISGVSDSNATIDTMRDQHRVLVDKTDRINNRGQVRRLVADGFKGYVSFEPFAASVHKDKAIARSLARSMDFMEG
jgi:2-keto-myo-inositol isomerase